MMDEPVAAVSPVRRVARKKKRPDGSYKALRLRLRRWLVESEPAMRALAALITGWLRLVRRTNSLVVEIPSMEGNPEPAILALWHGQHLLAPAIYPSGRGLSAMVSRSADAELNAMVLERFGVEAVRGSGGRVARRHAGELLSAVLPAVARAGAPSRLSGPLRGPARVVLRHHLVARSRPLSQ